MTAMERIRTAYRVPVRHGLRVRFEGRPCTIVGADQTTLRLRVRFDGQATASTIHPTWRVEYPDQEDGS